MIFKALLQWYEDGLYYEMKNVDNLQSRSIISCFISINFDKFEFSFKPIYTMDISKMLSFYDTIADLFTKETLYTKNLHYFLLIMLVLK